MVVVALVLLARVFVSGAPVALVVLVMFVAGARIVLVVVFVMLLVFVAGVVPWVSPVVAFVLLLVFAAG